MIGTDADRKTQASGNVRYNIPGEQNRAPLVFLGFEYQYLDILQVAVRPYPADQRFHANVVGSQFRQLYLGMQRHGDAAGNRVRSDPITRELYLGPGVNHTLAPAGPLASGLELLGPHGLEGPLRGLVELREILANHSLAVEVGAQIP